MDYHLWSNNITYHFHYRLINLQNTDRFEHPRSKFIYNLKNIKPYEFTKTKITGRFNAIKLDQENLVPMDLRSLPPVSILQ
jgi:hypothetical protein